jgi:hypothetical protein
MGFNFITLKAGNREEITLKINESEQINNI